MYNVSYSNNNTFIEVTWKHPLLGILLIIFCIITIFGNLLVIFAVVRERYLKSATNYYIVSLAVADLIVGLIVMPNAALHEMSNNIWFFGQLWCDLWHSFDVFASTASINSLLIIALDRHSAISDPINYPTRWLTRYWLFFVAVIWICAAIISFPAIAYWRYTLSNTIFTYDHSLMCVFTDDQYYKVFSSLVSFYIPLSVMIFVYIRIYRAATRQMIALKTGQKTDLKNPDGTQLTLRIHRGGYHGAPGYINNNTKENQKALGTFYYVKNDTDSQNKFKSKSSINLKSKKNYSQANSIPQIVYSEFDDNVFEDNLVYMNNLSSTNNISDQEESSNLKNEEDLKVHDSKRLETYRQHYLTHQNDYQSKTCVHLRHDSNASSVSSLNRNSKVKQMISKKMLSFNLTKKFCKFSREQKAAKTLGIVMGVFIFCWLPFFIYNVITGIFKAKLPNSNELFSIFTWLGYINSGCNPVIYGYTSRDFRRAFYKILCPTSFMRNHHQLATRDAPPTSTDQTKRNIVTTNCNICQTFENISNNGANLQLTDIPKWRASTKNISFEEQKASLSESLKQQKIHTEQNYILQTINSFRKHLQYYLNSNDTNNNNNKTTENTKQKRNRLSSNKYASILTHSSNSSKGVKVIKETKVEENV